MSSTTRTAISAKYELGLVLLFQVALIVLFGFFTSYHESADASVKNPKTRETDVSYPKALEQIFKLLYFVLLFQLLIVALLVTFGEFEDGSMESGVVEVFQDIHVMIFIGFGFLMTFLKRYGYSAVGFNLLLGALMIQWAILCRGFFAMHDGSIKISLKSMMGADIAAASVLISMGAVLGQTTFMQLLIMGVIEMVIFAANEYVLVDLFEVADVGGSMVVHTFGAYFGLAVSFMLRPKKMDSLVANKLEGPSYSSDIFAMIGTVFLWIFWPSFNGGLVQGDERHRAVINTYLSLAACTVTAFVLSALTSREKKFDMVHVQNSTLAGGVAVGSVCNMMLHPFGAILAGTLAGILSVCGYKYLTPKITYHLRMRDTCGVHNLHGMPGVFSALISVLLAYMASVDTYQNSLKSVFPAMNPELAHELHPTNGTHHEIRTSQGQAGYQALGLFVTVIMAIVTGLVTGIVLKTPFVGPLFEKDKYDDEQGWEVPDAVHHDDEDHHQVVEDVQNLDSKDDKIVEANSITLGNV